MNESLSHQAVVTQASSQSGDNDVERWLYSFAFNRVAQRKNSIKRQLDCGHWIDATEPYRYQVWRINADPRGSISQRTDCEFCARRDSRY